MYNAQDGIREYEAKNHDYLQAQIGNPDGADKPNKKYYDPRMPLRAAEEATVERLGAVLRPPQFFADPTHLCFYAQARPWRT